MKYRMAATLIVLGLALAVLTMPFSGAMNSQLMDRLSEAPVVTDQSAGLKLEGFNTPSMIIDIDKKYIHVGYVTNNTKNTINLTVTITPDFSLVNTPKHELGIKFASVSCVFVNSSSPSQQLILQLAPGQKIDVQAYMTGNKTYEVMTSFDFSGADTAVTYALLVQDTLINPRNIVFR